jgi:hypothetical protein
VSLLSSPSRKEKKIEKDEPFSFLFKLGNAGALKIATVCIGRRKI